MSEDNKAAASTMIGTKPNAQNVSKDGPTPGHWYGSEKPMTEVAIMLCGGKIPTRGSAEAAGWDLYSPANVILNFKQPTLVKLGIKTIIEPGYYFQVFDRSGLALKGVSTRGGVVDSDYRDEWGVVLFNETNGDITIQAGERIAQAVLFKLPTFSFEEVNSVEFAKSNRGGGFGSTGL